MDANVQEVIVATMGAGGPRDRKDGIMANGQFTIRSARPTSVGLTGERRGAASAYSSALSNVQGNVRDRPIPTSSSRLPNAAILRDSSGRASTGLRYMAATLHWFAIAPLSLINSNDLAPAAYDFETRNNARNVTAKVGRAVPVPKQGGLGKTLASVPLSTRISRINSDRRLPADAEDHPETRDPQKGSGSHGATPTLHEKIGTAFARRLRKHTYYIVCSCCQTRSALTMGAKISVKS